MDLKKKMTVGDILDYSIDIFKANYKKYFLLMLIFHVPVTFIISLMTGNLNIFINDLLTQDYENVILTDIILYQLGVSLNSLYASVFLNVLNVSVMKMTYDLIIYNRTDNTRNLLKYGLGKFVWIFLALLIETTVASIAVTILAFFLFLVIGIGGNSIINIIFAVLLGLAGAAAAIYYLIRFSLTGACVSIDGLSVFKAMNASYKLTRGKFWKTFSTLFFSNALFFFVSEIFTTIVILIPFSSQLLSRITFAVTNSLSALFFPFTGLVAGFLYTKYKADSGQLELRMELDRMIASMRNNSPIINE